MVTLESPCIFITLRYDFFMRKSFIAVILSALVIWALADGKAHKSMKTEDKAPEAPKEKVEKSNDEWKKILTPEEFRVLREAGTESPNGKIYQEFKKQGGGTYYCVACNAELFSSAHKFDSHCGWPSFYDAANNKSIVTRDDFTGGMQRTEVLCAKCGSHLGHLFKGEGFATPKNQRYCINGVCLKYVPEKK